MRQNEHNLSVQPEALSIAEFGAFAGLGKTLIYQLINQGLLKTRRVGRRRIILLADARAFLEALPTE